MVEMEMEMVGRLKMEMEMVLENGNENGPYT